MPIEKCPYCEKEYNTLYFHSCEKKPLGFGWGYFWITTQLLFSFIVIVVVIFGFYTEELIKDLSDKGIDLTKAFLQTGLGLSLSLGSAIGLLKRKRWGLYLVFVVIGLGFLGGIINLIRGTESFVFGVIYLLVGYLWFAYFYRRREWFK